MNFAEFKEIIDEMSDSYKNLSISQIITTMLSYIESNNIKAIYNEDLTHYNDNVLKVFTTELNTLGTLIGQLLVNINSSCSQEWITACLKRYAETDFDAFLSENSNMPIEEVLKGLDPKSQSFYNSLGIVRSLHLLSYSLTTVKKVDPIWLEILETIPAPKTEAEKIGFALANKEILQQELPILMRNYMLLYLLVNRPLIVELEKAERDFVFKKYNASITEKIRSNRITAIREEDSKKDDAEAIVCNRNKFSRSINIAEQSGGNYFGSTEDFIGNGHSEPWVGIRLSNEFLDILRETNIAGTEITFKGRRAFISGLERVSDEEFNKANKKIRNKLPKDSTVQAFKITKGFTLKEIRSYYSYWHLYPKSAHVPNRDIEGSYLVVLNTADSVFAVTSTTLGRAISTVHRRITNAVIDSFDLSF